MKEIGDDRNGGGLKKAMKKENIGGVWRNV